MIRPTGSKGVVLALLEAADRRDFGAMERLFSDDYQDHAGGGSRGGTDKQHALDAFREIARAFPDTRHDILAIIEEGEMVVARVSASGRHLAPFRGVAPTGDDVTITSTTIYRVSGGQIRERWCDGIAAIADQLTPNVARSPGLMLSGGPWRADVDGARYRELALDGLSFTIFELEGDVDFPEHGHESEQITYVIEGRLEFALGEETYSIGPGEAIALPSFVRHSVRSSGPRTLAVDAWSPPQSHLAPS